MINAKPSSESEQAPFNVLISSAGRRVSLIGCFREALRDTGVTGRVLAIDNSSAAPAFHLADEAWTVPACSDESFADRVLELALREKVKLIVPTIDPELPLYARNRARFAAHGIAVSIPDETTVHICSDKLSTYEWLIHTGLPTVRTAKPETFLSAAETWRFPLIVKPRHGSASVGVAIVDNLVQLQTLMADRSDLIVQQIAEGIEYTVNFYVDHSGRCLASVPHRRIQTRGGEVSKGVTVRERSLIELGEQVAQKLPGSRGAMNVQCFMSPKGQIRVIEINARFGGGYPLTHRAGARFAHWLVAETLGKTPTSENEQWADKLMMLRYDQEFYISLKDLPQA